MILGLIYFALICFLIWKTALFGVLRDDKLNSVFFVAAFIVKSIAVMAFWYVYQKLYGGLKHFDTWHFYNDSRTLHDLASWDFSEFLKVMFGLHDESANTELFKKFLSKTEVWDKDPSELLYNDNRLVIRLHALIQFISFGKYPVHAIMSCLMSLIGITWIYKAFKFLFRGREVLLILIWILFPGVWFWSGGLLKEAPALLLMGGFLVSAKRFIIDKERKPLVIFSLLICITLSFFLKHYLMLPLVLMSLLFFFFVSSSKRPALFYTLSVVIAFFAADVFLRAVFGKSAVSVLEARQRTFVDVANGGIFLLDDVKFARLKYDWKDVIVDSTQKPAAVRIKKGVSFSYWEHSHQGDTLYCGANQDTGNVYKIEYTIVPANSGLKTPLINRTYLSLLKVMPQALVNTTLVPFFFDARNALDILASLENLLIICAVLFIFFNAVRAKDLAAWVLYFFSMALLVLLIIGITSPNIGAIERYRALIAPFFLMGALFGWDVNKAEENRFIKAFKQ